MISETQTSCLFLIMQKVSLPFLYIKHINLVCQTQILICVLHSLFTGILFSKYISLMLTYAAPLSMWPTLPWDFLFNEQQKPLTAFTPFASHVFSLFPLSPGLLKCIFILFFTLFSIPLFTCSLHKLLLLSPQFHCFRFKLRFKTNPKM